MAKQSQRLAKRLDLEDAQCRRIYFCALLHEIGMVGLSDDAIENIDLSNPVDEALHTYPVIGHEIVNQVKRLAPLARSILYQNEM